MAKRRKQRVDQSDTLAPPSASAALPSAPSRQAFAVQIVQRLHDPHPGAEHSLAFLDEWLAEQHKTRGHVFVRYIKVSGDSGVLEEKLPLRAGGGYLFRAAAHAARRLDLIHGGAGWYYRAGLEWILGLQIRAGQLLFDPCIPKAWRSYNIFYQYENTRYEITVENPNCVSRGIATIELDGERQLKGNSITLQDDGQLHRVRVVVNKLLE